MGAANTLDQLRPEVDHLVCLEAPTPFNAIGAHHADFERVFGEAPDLFD